MSPVSLKWRVSPSNPEAESIQAAQRDLSRDGANPAPPKFIHPEALTDD